MKWPAVTPSQWPEFVWTVTPHLAMKWMDHFLCMDLREGSRCFIKMHFVSVICGLTAAGPASTSLATSKLAKPNSN